MQAKLSVAATVAIGWLLLSLGACTPEDEELTLEAGAQLAFGQDTVQFDTIFTSVGSTTRWLQVYNPQDQAVNISSIALGASESSPFRIRVNGDAGSQFQDVRLRGGDSLLILVEVEIDPQDADLPFIIKDSIVFRTNGTVQAVNLEVWGQDAYFLSGEVVTRNTTFSGGRPYVIRDSLWVLPSATLTLTAGAQLYFDNRAYMQVDGTLIAEGTPDARVRLQHVRSDGDYADALGQWQGVFFGPNSKNNRLNYTIIRNAVIGVGIVSPDNDTVPDITLANTVIEYMASYGILARYTDVDAYNTLIANCAEGSVRGEGRAYYRFRHCTMTNEGSFFIREDNQPLLGFDQNYVGPEGLTQDFSLRISNCIVWGNLDNELLFGEVRPENPVGLSLLNTILNSTDEDEERTEANLYNQEPLFVAPAESNYQLDSLSPAVDAGLNLDIEQDLNGNPRDAQPDVGAYEFIGQ